MLAYIVKRVLLMIPTFLGITLVTFLIIRLAPGDPVMLRFGAAGEGADAGGDREKQILDAKVRLGLMEERGILRSWGVLDGASAGWALRAHESEVRAVAVAPGAPGSSGALIATGGSDGMIRLWRDNGRGRAIAAGELAGHTGAVNALAMTADGSVLASAGDDRSVRLWRIAQIDDSGTAAPALVLVSHTARVNAVALSPDGALMASGAEDRTIRLWDVASGTARSVLEGHTGGVTALVFAENGTRLVSGGRDRLLMAWDVARATKLEQLDIYAVPLALAMAPDGASIAAGLDDDSMVILPGGELTASPPRRLRGHTGAVLSLAFDPAGRHLASGSRDKSIRIWDIARGASEHVLTGHTSGVGALAYLPDGGHLISGSLDIVKVPLLKAYGQWLARLVRLDLGRSFKDNRPVRDRLMETLPVTLELNLLAIFLTYLFSIPIGVLAAARRNGWFDQCSSVALFLLYSMPSFWVATMLIVIAGSPKGFFAEWLGFTLPFVNVHSDDAARLPYMQYVLDHVHHMILPLAAMTYGTFAFLSRLVRSSMLEVLHQDFVRTARAKGLDETRVIGVHTFRNALIPVVTVFGNLLPALIGGTVIIESIFSIPGMGRLGFEAILQRDYPTTMGITTAVAVLTMLGILISDILYCLVDPRIEPQ